MNTRTISSLQAKANQQNHSPRFARFSRARRADTTKTFKSCLTRVPVQQEKEVSPNPEARPLMAGNKLLLEKLSKVTWKSGKRATGRFYEHRGQWFAELHYTTRACKKVTKLVEQAQDGTLFVRFNKEADFITGTKEDDIKTREYIMWNRVKRAIVAQSGEVITVGPPRTWVYFYNEEKITRATEEQQNRAEEVLAEARRVYKDYTATVLEFSTTCGVTVMWTSSPQELKEKYNVSDLKTFDSWCLDWKFDSEQLAVGMKVRMRPDSVQCKGKYSKRPLIRGVLLSVVPEQIVA